MAKTRDYLDYLDQHIEIAPANSQEEYQAAETISELMRDHGLDPAIEEFEARPYAELIPHVLSLLLLICLVTCGLTQGAVHIVFIFLNLLLVGLPLSAHFMTNIFENFGPAVQSQNVVAVHRAEGSKVVKGARPIVIVAHYDTPRESLLWKGPLARYQAALRRVAIVCQMIVAFTVLVQVLMFLPGVVLTFFWAIGLIATLPLVMLAVLEIIAHFGSCTYGSNDNKSSLAALFTILDKVRPADDRATGEGVEHPTQRRAGDDRMERRPAKPTTREVVDEVYGVRHGRDMLLSLGILPPSCEVVYEEPRVHIVEETFEPDVQDEPEPEPEPEPQFDSEPEPELQEELELAPEPHEEPEPEETESDQAQPADEPAPEEPVEDVDASEADEQIEAYDDEPYDDEPYDEDDEDYDADEPADQESYEENEYDEESYEESDDEWSEGYEDYEDYEDESYEDDEFGDDEGGGTALGTWFAGRIASIKSFFSRKHEEEEDIVIERGEDQLGEEDWLDGYSDDSEEDDLDEFATEDYDEDEDTEGFADDEAYDEDELEDDEDLEWDDSFDYDDSTADEIDELEDDEPFEDDYDLAGEYDDFDEDDVEDELESVAASYVADKKGRKAAPQPQEQPAAPRPFDYLDLSQIDGEIISIEEYEEIVYVDEEEEVFEDDIEVIYEDEEAEAEEEAKEDIEELESDAEDLDTYDEPYEEAYDDEVYEDEETFEDEEFLDDDAYDGDVYDDYEDPGYDDEEEFFDEDQLDEQDEYLAEDEFADDDELLEEDEFLDDEEFLEEDLEDDYDDPYAGADATAVAPTFGQRIKGAFRKMRGGKKQESFVEDAEEYEEEDLFDESAEPELLDDDPSYEDDLFDEEPQEAPAAPLRDPNLLHFDREEDQDILPRDTTGLDLYTDSYDVIAHRESFEEERIAPQPIDDPSWGTSSYTPAKPTMNIARRAALFDIPDPSASSVDPLGDGFGYGDEDVTDDAIEAPEDSSAFWGDSSSPKSGWKGGAALRSDLRDDQSDEPIVIDADDLQDAILEFGDEYLLAHDIWFVATGASEFNHAGIKAFIEQHRRDIRGSFLVNLEAVGAGMLSVLTQEGLRAGRRADRRLVRMLTTIAQDLHIGLDTAPCNWGETDAATTMRSRIRSVTITGLDDNNLPAFSHSQDDVPENVDPNQVSSVARIVTELIRRA